MLINRNMLRDANKKMLNLNRCLIRGHLHANINDQSYPLYTRKMYIQWQTTNAATLRFNKKTRRKIIDNMHLL